MGIILLFLKILGLIRELIQVQFAESSYHMVTREVFFNLLKTHILTLNEISGITISQGLHLGCLFATCHEPS